MLPFLESPRFNVEIRYGMTGGPLFSTDVVTKRSGEETRNSNWIDSKGEWEMASDTYDKLEMEALASFFRERQGSLGAFRFKDWSDWRVTKEQGVLVPSATPEQLQMARAYKWGGETAYRKITKPVPGTIVFYDSLGNELSDIDVDHTTGRIVSMDTSITWSGEFDVPAHFGVDSYEAEFSGYRKADGETLYVVSGLTIIEVSA